MIACESSIVGCLANATRNLTSAYLVIPTMPPTKQDHYAALGLTSDASDNAIRAAYKKLALQWHPDRHLVGKERAAQKFIEVNQAYHALMDGKESTHSSSSSSTDTSSTTSATTSTEPTHSDTQTKNTSQASSRPPSASSNSSKRSNPPSGKSSSSKSSDSHDETKSKPSPHSTTPPSPSKSSQRSSFHDRKSDSHPRRDKPRSADGDRPSSDRMKSGRKFSKSHDHLRDPPGPAAPQTTSSASRSSERLDGSVRSKTSEKTASSSHSTEAKRDSRPGKTSRSRTGASHTTKPVIPPPSGRLHKSPKFGLADDFVQKLSKGSTKEKKERYASLPDEQESTPYGSPLHAINTPRGASKEWIFPLALTLDEMYHGTSYRFLVTRELLSHRTEQVEISIDIPPGMRSGTRIVCPRTGHQRKDGTLQDVVFLVEEVPDERFSRVKDDLFLDVCIPWADGLADQGGELCVYGIDGKEITFTLPYPIYDKATEGQVLVKGAGMPIRDGRKTVGRGDMIVRWRVVFPAHQSKWQTFKKALHLDL